MSFRLFAVLLVFPSTSYAQFFGLSTPFDGSSIYFATPLRQKDTAQPQYGKIFRVDANGLSLQESRSYQAPPPSDGPPVVSNPYDLQFTEVSSDGKVTATAALRDCYGQYGICAKTDLPQVTTITAPAGSQDFPGELHLSANGQWAFGGQGQPGFSQPDARIINIGTGEQQFILVAQHRAQVAANGRPIANNGTAVFSDGDALVILHGAQTRRVPIPDQGQPSDAVIDADGTTVVFTVTGMLAGGLCPSCRSLQAADVGTGEISVLDYDGYAPALSDDGRTILYISNHSGTPQLWLTDASGGGHRQVMQDPLGITRAILSGDGRIGYAVTLGGRLLKVEVASGGVVELIPRTPFIDSTSTRSISPGTMTVFSGEGLSDSVINVSPPLPYSLGGTQVSMQGRPALIAGIKPGALTVLTPADLTPALYPTTFASAPSPISWIELDVDSPSPFAGPRTPLSIRASVPCFLYESGTVLVVAHQDWSGTVNSDSPAHPGEVIHVYAGGLGPTSPDVSYGLPAPSQEPLARLIAPYRCQGHSLTLTTSTELPVLFAGLAPGLAGVYQMDLQLPADAVTGPLFVLCYEGSTVSLSGLISIEGSAKVQAAPSAIAVPSPRPSLQTPTNPIP